MKVSAYTRYRPHRWRGWLLLALTGSTPLAYADGAPNPTTLPFPSGGVIVMKINQGEVSVVGVAEERISVSRQSRIRDDERNAKIRLESRATSRRRFSSSAGTTTCATASKCRGTLTSRSTCAPASSRSVALSAAWDVDLIAGEMNLRVSDPSRYKAVSASVTAGQLTAKPWCTDALGLWRSLKAKGGGDLELRARLIAGELTIDSE
jgi:hypothetical protein